MGYTRWVKRGELREVDYARYESPSEMFHSLIFFLIKGFFIKLHELDIATAA